MAFFGDLLFYVGAATLLYFTTQLVRFVLRHFTGSHTTNANLKALKPKAGGWAVVTGASDGIGRAYCVELAKLGFNVVLISRTAAKLEKVAEELRAFGVETSIVAVDFGNADEDAWARIQRALASKHLSVLVNNVGINYGYPKKVTDSTYEDDEAIVRVNTLVAVRLAHLVLPVMVDNGAGLLINLSSFSGRIATPMLAIYSGTKAFLDFWSKAVNAEYAAQGIHSMSITPGMVTTNMSKIKRTSPTVCSPEHIARRTLARAGLDIELSPFYTHGIMVRVLESLPLWLQGKIVLGQNQQVAKRAIAKAQRAASA